MDIIVRTGETKASSGTSLAALAFSSPHGEHACFLLHSDAQGQDAKTCRDECAAIIQHSLLDSEGEAWTRLDGALKELNGFLKGFVASGTIKDVHAIVALIDRSGMLHVSAAGRGEAYLIRGGVASQVTEFTKGKPVAAFIHISSGQMEPGDDVVFSTQRLLRALTPAQLAQLSHSGDKLLDSVITALQAEREPAALASVRVPGASTAVEPEAKSQPEARSVSRSPLPSRRANRRGGSFLNSLLQVARERAVTFAKSAGTATTAFGKRGAKSMFAKSGGSLASLKEKGQEFLSDLKDPRRKRKAHLLLFAGAIATFLIVWLVISLLTSSQRSKTRAELSELVSQINGEIQTADNRHLAGDDDGASAILQQAEQHAKQVMDNESSLFRVEALDMLDRIRSKREQLENILRVPARVSVNMSSGTAAMSAQGLIGLEDGEFVVYDRQNSYRIILNRLDEPKRVVEDDLILQGADFPRYKSQVFMTTGNSVIELSGTDLTPMKTEDPAGWATGKDIKTYLRYLYVLSPDKKQILKYERLSNRYAAPVDYNVNGDLTGALSMTIDTSVYVLKEGGTVLKLLRGETQPFAIRHAPADVLKDTTKMFKISSGDFYFLDPVKNRVIVTTDGGGTGESSYLKQYILEGEQLGTLQDLYVDPDESHLYVLDEKRLYVVDLVK